MREYKRAYKNYPDAVEELMDCRGDIMATKEEYKTGMNLEEKVMWFAIGVIATVLIEKNAGK